MAKKRKIVLTGGGSTGHVSVNLALIPLLRNEGWDIHYFGSKNGIEKELITGIEGVTYHKIATGKLRRFLSFQNIIDIFKVIGGIFQSIFKIFTLRPDVIFSKGGYVSVPVIIGGWVNRVPSISHESDLTPGLANKLVQPFVNTIFTTFPETTSYIKSGKGEFLGPVIRQDLFNGNKEKAKNWLKITNEKPVLLAMGGSLGAKFINDTIRNNLDSLLRKFNIIHIVGKDSVDKAIKKENYFQFEYIKEELKDIFDYADLVLSRSGSNAIFEFLYYKIPMILIPLPKSQSRGDQFDNAKSFEKEGFAIMIDEDESSDEKILLEIAKMYNNLDDFKDNMKEFKFDNTIEVIYKKIDKISKSK